MDQPTPLTPVDDFLPYGRQVIDDDDIAAVTAVLRGDWLTTGPAIERFEDAFRHATGAAYAIACANGTAALHLAALAHGLGPGDQVLVPAVTFLATANAVRYVGADVVFADVDPQTGLMTAASVAAAIAATDRPVKAIMPVHLTGHTVGLSTLAEALQGRLLIEDACHALGSEYADGDGTMVPVGSCPYGGVTMFSSHPVKTIATGEGGMLTTNDGALAQRLRQLRNHGIVRDAAHFRNQALAFDLDSGAVNPWYYEMHALGFNYRQSDIHAALGVSQMAKLPSFIARRRALHAHYCARLADAGPHIQIQPTTPASHPAWHLAVALIDFVALGISRATVMTALRERGIGSQVHYQPVPWQPYYQQRYGPADFPGASAYYGQILSLPLYPSMTEADVDRVVDGLLAVTDQQR